jgi:hypothetical protein
MIPLSLWLRVCCVLGSIWIIQVNGIKETELSYKLGQFLLGIHGFEGLRQWRVQIFNQICG